MQSEGGGRSSPLMDSTGPRQLRSAGGHVPSTLSLTQPTPYLRAQAASAAMALVDAVV